MNVSEYILRLTFILSHTINDLMKQIVSIKSALKTLQPQAAVQAQTTWP